MLAYVHLPLCRRKCRYCAFVSWDFSEDVARQVVDAVLADVARWGRRGVGPVRTLYLGGGTPSLWEVADLARIVEAVDRSLGFAPDAEVSVEANPESALRPGWIAGLRALGVQRISLGVQSFDDARLAFLGRPHDARLARQAVAAAVAAGLAVNVDLLWNVPGQDLEAWCQDVLAALHLGVQHLSCYSLTCEFGTPLARQSLLWPAEELAAAQFQWTCQTLEEQGFEHYEIANFARPGFRCRHNCGYWAGEEYLGFGPAAVSTWQGSRWANPPSLTAYAQVVAEDRIPQGESLTAEVVARERIMLALRTRDGLDVKAWARAFGQDVAVMDVLWSDLVQAGLAYWDGVRARLSVRGMLLANAVCTYVLDRMEQLEIQGTYA